MFLKIDQLEKQLDKDEFQEIGSMAAFRVLETQCQKFIKSRISLDDEDGIMTRKYFLEYTQLEVQQFRDTLIQHMEFVKKSIDERALHKREYDRRPMAEVQLTTECNVFATRQQHIEQPGFNNKGEVDQNAKQCHDAHPLPAKLTDNQTTELSNQSLKSENISLKEWQHGQFSKVKSNEAKVKHDMDVTGTINIELEHKVAKLLKENETLKKHYKELSTSGKRVCIVGLRWVPTGKIFSFSITTVDSEPPHGSNIDITNLYECIQTLDSSACTSINVQEERNLNLSAGTPSILKKERIKKCIKENVISGRPRLHGITLIQEISARQSSQGIQSLLTS
ncbi:hypothetical protein Tco_1035198 [Tanacetum coccineum]